MHQAERHLTRHLGVRHPLLHPRTAPDSSKHNKNKSHKAKTSSLLSRYGLFLKEQGEDKDVPTERSTFASHLKGVISITLTGKLGHRR